MVKLVFLAVTQAILMCLTQSLFKVAADRMPAFSWSWAFFRDGIMLNWVLALSALLGVATLAEWVYMLRQYPFSQIYPLSSLSYLFAMFVALVFFKETIVWQQWLGIFLILAGCVLVAR